MAARHYDVVILGAGAAGMMCAVEAGRRGRSVLVADHARNPGEKIRISGGGRCNFTNLDASPKNFLSRNPRFSISALSRYTPRDFIAMVERNGIAWHEKAKGQLFCDGSARQVVDMLLAEMRQAGAELRLSSEIGAIERAGEGFRVDVAGESVECAALVIATGGKSIPKMGASGFGYQVAAQFGLGLTEIRPALVPLTFEPAMLEQLSPLAGVAVEAVARAGKVAFEDALLFTHRGLSGPAILQISSYWHEGDEIVLSLAPQTDVFETLRAARAARGRQAAATVLSDFLPKRLAQRVTEAAGANGNLADLGDKGLRRLDEAVNSWRVKPAGSEGYRTAEVTLGGVDTAGLDSRTLQAKTAPGLYFIGEVVDVTGWLGGYNFQWAWSSGWCAGQVV